MAQIPICEHLYQMHPQMPKYANDPEQSEIIRTYDLIMKRFQGYFGKPPLYFVKAPATPILLGDSHDYIGFNYLAFNSTQNVIIAISPSNSQKIKINHYQSALFGEQVLSTDPNDWKFSQDDKYINIFIKALTTLINEHSLKQIIGLDILIYSDFMEEEFMGWKEALVYVFYLSIHTVYLKQQSLDGVKLRKAITKIRMIEPTIKYAPQLTNYKYGSFTFQNPCSHSENLVSIDFESKLSLVIAHSMTPLPKKLIQGKRFNLRRCQVLIGIEYIKSGIGLNKDIRSIQQLQESIGCTTEELLETASEHIPKGKVTNELIEQHLEVSLIDILKEVPFANNVIDQNTEFHPYNRFIFFLKEQLLLQNATNDNLVESVKQSYRNQKTLLDIGSQQIDQMIKIGQGYSLAFRIIGNGWGGNIVFICDKSLSGKLVEDLIQNFYLSKQNRILLSDDIEQYIRQVGRPHTGLMILDPQSQIWY